MNNRKKALKLKSKRNIVTHVIRNSPEVTFFKVKCHYVNMTGDFVCEVRCLINNQMLHIKGILYPEELAVDCIKIKTPSYMKSKEFNCVELGFTKKDTPNLCKSIRNYVDFIGDQLDSNNNNFSDYKLESIIGLKDKDLESEKFYEEK